MSRFREVPNAVNFADLEREVLERWNRDATFARSVERRRDAPRFVFYDGPPFATGLPHYGHILTSFIKDVVPRYYTMRGYYVPRRWGWDCHGLPVELEVEKTLGLSSRADIVRLGVGRFNDECRRLVMRYQAEWEQTINRLGRWVDFENAYKTMDPDYIESVVWCFKRLHERGLVYEGQKVVAYCARCQTALSNFEARLDDAFRPRDDLALTVRFRLVERRRESLLAWTTTPWTLPANVALALHPELEYLRLERDGESVWLAAAARERYAASLEGFSVRETKPGRALVGCTYEPLFPYFRDARNAFRVITADWVAAAEGTGVVHVAPAFGEDDQAVGAAYDIEAPNPVRDDGTFDERVADFAGLSVLAANEPIARTLAARGALLRREMYRHSYPHCWRCDEPLLYRAIATWFVRVTAFKDQMLACNERIRWVPEHVGPGRFAAWLANARDWAVSRNRFFGAPVPVWRCEGCGETHVVGSRAELEQRSGRQLVDWHRPHIDAVVLPCATCGGTMRRVPEVLDCWFESGAMPYGQVHHPFAPGDELGASFPADFIVEYIAQTRGWFYTMVALAAALFDKPPFKNAVCHGVILAADGRKMSKRLRNYPDPMVLVDEHGADALRAALLMSGAVSGMDIRFAAASVRDCVRRLHLPLWNVLHLVTSYATLDGFAPSGRIQAPSRLDRALLAEAELLRADVEAAMERYDFAAAYAAIEELTTSLSTWYVRLMKPALWRQGLDPEKRATYEVLFATLQQVAKVIAPFLPFVAELLYAALGGEDSVHLADWPAPRPEWRDDALVAEMRNLRAVVRLARRAREQNGIKHRQPLRRAWVAGLTPDLLAHSVELLAGELNVKELSHLTGLTGVANQEVVLDYAKVGKRLRGEVKRVAEALRHPGFELAIDNEGRLAVLGHMLTADEFTLRFVPSEAERGVAAEGELVVLLDLTLDEALVREGLARDLNRVVQDLRKRARLAYDEPIVVAITGGGAALDAALREHESWLRQQCLASRIDREPLPDPLATTRLEGEPGDSETSETLVAIARQRGSA